jgi:signal transduction histidine kinase
MIDLYSDRGRYQIIILLIALLIGGASVYYTNYIISHLAQREEEEIRQYAQELQLLLERSEAEDTDRINEFLRTTMQSNKDIPLLLADSSGIIIDSKNIPVSEVLSKEERDNLLQQEFERMKEEHKPIIVEDKKSGLGRQYIYFHNSYLLEQLTYFPYVQIVVVAVFFALAFMAFSYSKRAEQNRVWIGLAKETAHQLGTPLSSLMGWIEYFKSDPSFADASIISELEKDVNRLERITARFSQIGSVPALKPENVYEVVNTTVEYLRKRISTKVKIKVINKTGKPSLANMNRNLFEWVIENICKNAVDAMSGVGELTVVVLLMKGEKIAIDITDTGKGIQKNHLKRVFEPGFSTKKRGWGLGLTLAKRIIENYHNGKIFVKQSEPGKGTTFRIILDRTKAAISLENAFSDQPLVTNDTSDN